VYQEQGRGQAVGLEAVQRANCGPEAGQREDSVPKQGSYAGERGSQILLGRAKWVERLEGPSRAELNKGGQGVCGRQNI
jgi:hypothetical protein